METGISLLISIYFVVPHPLVSSTTCVNSASVLRHNTAGGGAGRTAQLDYFRDVVRLIRVCRVLIITCPLFPDNNGIVGRRHLVPLGIEGCILRKGAAERKPFTGRVFSLFGGRAGIPAVECISVSGGGFRFHCYAVNVCVIPDNELRGRISGTLSVSFKIQPVAFRRIYRQNNISCNGDICIVLIGIFRQGILGCHIFSRSRIPAHEYLILVRRGIHLIDGVIHTVTVGDQGIGTQGDAIFVLISDGESLEDHGIEIMHFVFLDLIRVCLFLCPGPDIGDTHLVVDIFDFIVLFFDPSFEQMPRLDCARAGIINDLLQFLGRIVVVLYIDGSDRLTAVLQVIEVQRHTGLIYHDFTCADNGVDGEPVCLKGDFTDTVSPARGLDVYRLGRLIPGIKMIDTDRVTAFYIDGLVVFDIDTDRTCRLHFFSFMIEGNIKEAGVGKLYFRIRIILYGFQCLIIQIIILPGAFFDLGDLHLHVRREARRRIKRSGNCIIATVGCQCDRSVDHLLCRLFHDRFRGCGILCRFL